MGTYYHQKFAQVLHWYLDKVKILTILGTRPEIIRLSLIMRKLDGLCDHHVLHTGQNYDPNLSDIFFTELGLRTPDTVLDNQNVSQGEQIGRILDGTDKVLDKFQPDRVLILGDTNSGLASIVCRRRGVPVYHMEAGNRCYDDRVPEEANRKIIDNMSTINLPYTEFSRQNLLREGFPNNQILTTGNPINEVIRYYQQQITASDVLTQLNLKSHEYVIATAHRAENVDNQQSLRHIITALSEIATERPVVFSCHPRTRQKLDQFGISTDGIMMMEPVGFFDFVSLEQNCHMAISDSGTVQEELCLFHKPTVTIRETTERPETVMCGSNLISGVNMDSIMRCYRAAMAMGTGWEPPSEYQAACVSDTVVKILLGG